MSPGIRVTCLVLPMDRGRTYIRTQTRPTPTPFSFYHPVQTLLEPRVYWPGLGPASSYPFLKAPLVARPSPTHTYTHRPLQVSVFTSTTSLILCSSMECLRLPHTPFLLSYLQRDSLWFRKTIEKNELLAGYFLNYILKLYLGGHMSVYISSA